MTGNREDQSQDQNRNQFSHASAQSREIATTVPIGATPSARADRFLARLDAHLPIIPGRGARRAFLDRQLEGREGRYARFIATEGASEPATNPGDPPQAADFLLTITGLAARRNAHVRRGERQRDDARPGGLRRERPKHEMGGDHV